MSWLFLHKKRILSLLQRYFRSVPVHYTEWLKKNKFVRSKTHIWHFHVQISTSLRKLIHRKYYEIFSRPLNNTLHALLRWLVHWWLHHSFLRFLKKYCFFPRVWVLIPDPSIWLIAQRKISTRETRSTAHVSTLFWTGYRFVLKDDTKFNSPNHSVKQ